MSHHRRRPVRDESKKTQRQLSLAHTLIRSLCSPLTSRAIRSEIRARAPSSGSPSWRWSSEQPSGLAPVVLKRVDEVEGVVDVDRMGVSGDVCCHVLTTLCALTGYAQGSYHVGNRKEAKKQLPRHSDGTFLRSLRLADAPPVARPWLDRMGGGLATPVR